MVIYGNVVSKKNALIKMAKILAGFVFFFLVEEIFGAKEHFLDLNNDVTL